MTRSTIIMGNWKMNTSPDVASKLVLDIMRLYKNQDKKNKNKNKIIIFPPYIYLDKINQLLKSFPELLSVSLGAQNLSQYDNGAYTGEISGNMLSEIGCEYVLIGHSERRQFFGESDDVIAKKVKRAVEAGLKPVLCVGETQAQRQSHETDKIILGQLEAVLNVNLNLDSLILAYEPVWAIGTGLTATPPEAQAVHKVLRDKIREHDKMLGDAISIVYGGSVKANNAQSLLEMPDIDGALVGGAALNAEEFMGICKAG